MEADSDVLGSGSECTMCRSPYTNLQTQCSKETVRVLRGCGWGFCWLGVGMGKGRAVVPFVCFLGGGGEEGAEARYMHFGDVE